MAEIAILRRRLTDNAALRQLRTGSHTGLEIFSVSEYGGAKLIGHRKSQERRGDRVKEETCKSSASSCRGTNSSSPRWRSIRSWRGSPRTPGSSRPISAAGGQARREG